MKLSKIVQELNLKVLTDQKNFDSIEINNGYVSDLLSCVMAGAPHSGIWVTLQAHSNIVAVAALLDLAAVIITEGAEPDQATIEKANQEGMTLLSTAEKTFPVAGRLWEMGLR